MSRHLAKRLDDIEKRSRSGDKPFVVLHERDPDFAMKLEQAERKRQLIITVASFGRIEDSK